MKRLFGVVLLALALASSPLQADQYVLPYGWSGGNGILGYCLLSNGPLLPPSFQPCGGGASGAVDLNSVQTLTNKTLDGASNTFLNLPASQLVGQINITNLTGQWTVPNGGTGVGTLTGPIKGNGTSAFSAATAADITALYSGCTNTSAQYIASNGTCQTASGGGGTLANPTALVGLTAVNGTALTGTRSDGSPALDVSIVPTWTGAHTWSTTGTFSNALNAGRIAVTQTNVPAEGIYKPAGGTLGLSSGSTERAHLTSAGITTDSGGVNAAGTKFTTSGCSVSSTTGGAWAGTFTLGANSCNVVITIAGATGATVANGWTCEAHDRTAPTVLIGGESSSTTTTATIAIPAGAGTTDVISFHCHGF